MKLVGAFLVSLLGFVGCIATETTPTPDIPATVSAAVERALLTSTVSPTYTPYPTVTSSAKFSEVEAMGRLRIYFIEVAQSGQVLFDYKALWESYPGCDPWSKGSKPDCPSFVLQMKDQVTKEYRIDLARPRSEIYAEYQGKGTWLMVVSGFTATGEGYDEEWFLFERGGLPPQLVKNVVSP